MENRTVDVDDLKNYTSQWFFQNWYKMCPPPLFLFLHFLPLIETYTRLVCPSNFEGWLQNFLCLCFTFRLLVLLCISAFFTNFQPRFSSPLKRNLATLYLASTPTYGWGWILKSFAIHQLWTKVRGGIKKKNCFFSEKLRNSETPPPLSAIRKP